MSIDTDQPLTDQRLCRRSVTFYEPIRLVKKTSIDVLFKQIVPYVI